MATARNAAEQAIIDWSGRERIDFDRTQRDLIVEDVAYQFRGHGSILPDSHPALRQAAGLAVKWARQYHESGSYGETSRTVKKRAARE